MKKNSKKSNKSQLYAVIGLGRFGFALAQSLAKNGLDVIAVGKINDIFAGKGIKEYAISNVKGLGSNVFSYQNTLERLVINDEVTYIGNNCFSYCPNLRSITLPAGLEVVRYDPFIGSDNLEEVYFRSLLPPTIEIGGIDQDQYANLTIYVPEQSLDLYLSDPSWAPLNKYMEGYHYDDLE